MSVLRYNGITLPYASTTDFKQEAVGDDMGDTDRCYTRFDISVQVVLNAEYLSMIDQALVTEPWASDVTAIMDMIRQRLMARRRQLSFTFNGTEIIPARQGSNSGFVDAKNGPIPQSCICTLLTGTTFLVTYHIIAHYWENPEITMTAGEPSKPKLNNQKGSPVLYNRWTESVDMDASMFSIRTREGKYIIRSDNVEGKVADQLRTQLAVLSVPNGCVRLSSKYTVSADGLGISYVVTDKEVHRMPPSMDIGRGTPGAFKAEAFEADGWYHESCVGQGGVKRVGEVLVKLRAAKNVQQADLLRLAVNVGAGKIFRRGGVLRTGATVEELRANGNNNFIIENAYVRMGLYDNYVEYHMRVWFVSGNFRVRGQTGFAGIDDSVEYSDGLSKPPPYVDRGTASFLLRAAAYYDPTLTQFALRPEAIVDISRRVDRGDLSVQMPGTHEVGTEGP